MSIINVQEIVSALNGKQTGSGSWLCHCPSHDDKDPSLSISQKDGKILFKCFAGCTQEAVLNALKARGLWPEPAKRTKSSIVATYDYQDEKGILLFQVVRMRPKDFRQRRPDGKAWIWSLKGVRRVLYRLPELLKGEQVFVSEGEKDVDRLVSEGLTATTCPGGAGKWRDEYSEALRGKDCVILPDNDEPGRQHALKVAEALKNIAKSIKIIELSGLPAKGDVSDWFEAGHTKAELFELVSQAEPVNFEDMAKKPEPLIRSMPIAEFLTLKLPPRQTLLDPWLLSQGLAMVHAYRSTGKTFFSLGVACAVATGSKFLKWQASRPAGALYVDGEMAAISLQERLTATLADMDIKNEPPALHIVTPDILTHGVPDLSTLSGQAALEAVITADIKLIVLDNLSCLCRTGQENRSESWQPVQEWCLKMRSQGKSILLVHHDGKTKEQRGTSKKEDLLDTVIQLTRPGGYHTPEGCVFEVHFRKARELHGDVVRPFEAALTLNKGEKAIWTYRDIEESTRDKVRKLLDEGWQSKDIADELHITRGLVSRYKNEKTPDTSKLVNYSI